MKTTELGLNREASDYATALNQMFRTNFGEPRRSGAYYFPFVLGRRDLTTITAESLVASRFDGGIIEALRPHSGVIAAGAQVITGLKRHGNYVVPRIDNAPMLTWIDDVGPGVPTGDPDFDQCVIKPYTLCANINISRLLIKGASVADSIAAALSGEVQREMLAEVDRVAIAGTGVGQPLGILNDPDVYRTSAGGLGGDPDHVLLTDLEDAIGSVYVGNDLTWFVNAATRRKIRRTPVDPGIDPLWRGRNELLGYTAAVTEHIPGDGEKPNPGSPGSPIQNLSSIVLGDFSRATVAIWGAPAFEVLFNPYGENALSGKAQLSVFLHVGIGLRRKEAFVTCRDVITEL